MLKLCVNVTRNLGRSRGGGLHQRYATTLCRSGFGDLPRWCDHGIRLTAAGVASVLVPLVASSTSHQRANAQWLSKEGGAIHLPQSDMNPQQLATLVLGMKRERLVNMANAAYVQGRRNAVDTIAKILEDLAGV